MMDKTSWEPIDRILKNGKGLLMAYDHGFEYGPTQFDMRSVDPHFAIDLADSGSFTGFICQKGIAAKYYDKAVHQVPLILKLNGKTSFRQHDEPLSLQNTTVDEALFYGASAVGYVIHVGSAHEQQMIVEFGKIEREAHEKGLAVLAWMYVAGDDLVSPGEADTLAYSARVGMELNADGIIIKYSGNKETFEWVIANAGQSKIFVVGGPRTDTAYQLVDTAKDVIKSGAAGFAIGRNVWQAKDPEHVARQLATEIFGEE